MLFPPQNVEFLLFSLNLQPPFVPEAFLLLLLLLLVRQMANPVSTMKVAAELVTPKIDQE